MGGVDDFEWDNDKAASNLVKHGIEFDQAIEAFRDLFAIERIDNRFDYGEERYNLLAICDGIILHITYTERNGKIRLIPARKAKKREQEYYYRQNATRWDGC
jgi:uncharacterized DUF497 family protein